MPVPVDDLQDVRRLVRQLGLKIATVDDLQRLLAAINTSYNPDALRVKTIRIISTTAISASMGAAGVVSFIALASMGESRFSSSWGAPLIVVLAIMWVMAGAVSLATVLVSLRWLKQVPARSNPGLAGNVNETPPSAGAGSEQITTPDNLKIPRELP